MAESVPTVEAPAPGPEDSLSASPAEAPLPTPPAAGAGEGTAEAATTAATETATAEAPAATAAAAAAAEAEQAETATASAAAKEEVAAAAASEGASAPEESKTAPMAQHFSMADDSDEEVQQHGSRGSDEANDSFMGLPSGPLKASSPTSAAASAAPSQQQQQEHQQQHLQEVQNPPTSGSPGRGPDGQPPSVEVWLEDPTVVASSGSAAAAAGEAAGVAAGGEADLQNLAASVREKFQFMSKEDQQMLCRRHCELAQKREEAVLRQLQATIDRYTRALEVSRAVVRAVEKGATADANIAARLANGPRPGLAPELIEVYEARIRTLQEAMLAIRSEALVVLPRLTPFENAKGVAAAGVARTVAGFNKLKDGAGIAPALDSAQGFFSNFRTRWRTATGGSSQNAGTPASAAPAAAAPPTSGGAGATSDFPQAEESAFSGYQPPVFSPAPRDELQQQQQHQQQQQEQQPPAFGAAGMDEIAY
eukprot:CAMPEP_0206571790 /NCGR_PEP_ID=MMETSP0325_2-20121206/27856_1 /ASSEMBLY_ACC=CAM_ASM_000347 /TAXON_ID=2866 /ORGANISM="Crypthecodinium cohnii, Strain Seligo" /LENGTH=479 /DNA_ID=CAMNT_0054075863 /DNA_START=93 /DNA_END=1532 /DNA_ORIENTATION=+